MIRPETSHARSTLCVLAVLALACAFVPGPASARSDGEETLSPRLQQLAEPGFEELPPARQADRLDLPASGVGSLQRSGEKVLVEIRVGAIDAATLSSLRDAGVEVVSVNSRYLVVVAAVNPMDFEKVAALPTVAGVTPALAPGLRAPECGGAIRSEGDGQLNASAARAGFAVDGSGVTVGILSDSFDRRASAPTHAGEDIVAGDLPGPGSPCGAQAPVQVLDDGDGAGSDEGRAMAHIVHELAPGAGISFATATAPVSQYAFAAKIGALRAAGAQVLVDDVYYVAEPFFQEGPIAVAASEAVAAGVSYFTATGNDNVLVGGKDIGSWEARFAGTGDCPATIPKYPPEDAYDCTAFDGAADAEFAIAVAPGGTLRIVLQWAEPWYGVQSDFDAFLLDSTDAVVAKSEEDNVGSTRQPVEAFAWKNPSSSETRTVRLVVKRFSGTAKPRLKFAMLLNGAKSVVGSEYSSSTPFATVGPTVFGHAAAQAAISVGAVSYALGSQPEYYSSRGPATHYFGPVSGTFPAAPIVPETVSKPDLVATDCGANPFFGPASSPGLFRFCGTSAAAPHAAAVAALIRQANPAAGQAQVRAALTATARPVGAFGPSAVGAGLVDARAAVGALVPPPAVTITKAPPPSSNVRRPTFEFTANRPVAFTCQLDGRTQPCASPFTAPAALADGQHGFAVQATDLAGKSASSGVVDFRIDTTPPRTFFRKRPRKVIRTGKRRVWGTVAFGSNEAEVSYICKFDRDLPRYCPERIKRRFEVGRHRIVVRARDTIGNVDATAAVYKFRVVERGKQKGRRGR